MTDSPLTGADEAQGARSRPNANSPQPQHAQQPSQAPHAPQTQQPSQAPHAPNPYAPLFIDLTGKAVVVVGGGAVAQRKVANLNRHGCAPTVVAPAFTGELAACGDAGKAQLEQREYSPQCVQGAFLVFAATDDPALNARITADAQVAGALANNATEQGGEVIVPSEVQRGKLQLAISTSGASPAFAKATRLELEQRFDPAYEPYMELLAEVRKLVLQSDLPPKTRTAVLQGACDERYLMRLRDGNASTPQEMLNELLDGIATNAEEAV